MNDTRIAELNAELRAIQKFLSAFKNKRELKWLAKELEPKLIELALLTGKTYD